MSRSGYERPGAGAVLYRECNTPVLCTNPFSRTPEEKAMSELSRRELLGLAAALLPVVACGDVTSAAVPPVLPGDIPADAVVITADAVDVSVNRIAALSAVQGAVALLTARVIVVRTGASTYQALSADCPHSGCGVSIVNAPRLICPCHGSEFDFSGNRLAGPAPRGLTVLPSEFDATRGLLRVRRSAT